MALEEIFERQLRLQRESFGVDPSSLADEDKIEYIRWNVLALEDELHEALAEVSWKPWASDTFISRDAYVKELVDALHFLTNLFLVVGADAGEVLRRYKAKAEVNAARQEAGYEHHTNKDPVTGRALDEPE